MTCEIPLTQGKIALIDSEDWERVMEHSWCFSKRGYATSRINWKLITMHRFILQLPPRYPEVDHINRHPLDNRKENLRICTRAEQMRNTRGRGSNTGYKGITYRAESERYLAQIVCNGVSRFVGSFATLEQAIIAYNKSATELFGEFAYLHPVDDRIILAANKASEVRQLYRVNSSGFIGVTKHKNRWQAVLGAGQKRIYLGSFSTPEEAARARDAAALRLQETRNIKLNFPAPFAPPPESERRITYDRVDPADLPYDVPIRVPC